MKKNNNKLPLLILTGLTGLALINVILSVNWKHGNTAYAEIPYAAQKVANTYGGTMALPDSGIDKNGNSVTVWERTDDTFDKNIYFRRYDNHGLPLEPQETLVNTTTGGNQVTPAAAMDQDGNFVVAWAGNGNGDDSGIFMRVFKKDGTPLDSEIKVNTVNTGTQYQPSIAIEYNGDSPAGGGKTRVAVAWTDNDATYGNDVYYQLYDVNFAATSGATASVNVNQVVNSRRNGLQQNPSITINNFGEFIVAWDGEGVVNEQVLTDQIWIQAYENDATGLQPAAAQGPNTKINSTTLPWTQKPRVAADKSDNNVSGGNYVITYEGGSSSENSDIFARRIGRNNQNGCVLNAVELVVNTTQAGIQDNPHLSADYLGNFTIIWHDASQNNGDLYGQSYKYTGSRNGDEFHVNLNSGEPYNQLSPSVAMNYDGFYVIGFADANGADIIIQQYVSDLFKANNEGLMVTQENIAAAQEGVDVAVAPEDLVASSWKQGNQIRLFLYSVTGGSVKLDELVAESSTYISKPAISFFKDTVMETAGRFIIVFAAENPTCNNGESTNGKDIWYKEYNALGEPTPDIYCHRLNLNYSGNQTDPDVAAGYYNQDGNTVEDNFSVIYREVGTGTSAIRASFHNVGNFIEGDPPNPLESCSAGTDTDCSRGSVALDPTNNQMFFTYNKANNEVWGKTASFTGAAITVVSSNAISSTTGVANGFAKATMLPNNQVLSTYTKYNALTSPAAAQIIVKRFNFNDLSSPVDTYIIGTADLNFYDYSDVTSDPENGNILVVWTELPANPAFNYIYGQFYSYLDSSTNSLRKFGPAFKINSTQDGNRLFPSVSMNSGGNIGVSWEGRYEQNPGQSTGTVDSAGAIGQLLVNPLYTGSAITYAPLCTQQITPGDRYFEVPSSIVFPPATIRPTQPTNVEVAIRNNNLLDPMPIQYIQVTDLRQDNVPYSISVSADDFTHSDNTHTISKNNLAIRNCDASTMDDPSCIDTMQGPAADFSLNIQTYSPASPDGFVNFTPGPSPLILADGTGNSLGQWRFYPIFRLTIPAVPPITIPGTYTSTITFDLY